MNITTHPEYKEFIDEWEKIRDILKGEKYVKEKGVKYLPMPYSFESEPDPEKRKFLYNEYKDRATFINFSKRVYDALFGFLFKEDPEIIFDRQNISESAQKLLNDIDPDNNDYIEFSRNIAKEIISIGRVGILIDANENTNEHPYLSIYTAENILDWEVQNNKLYWVLLYEPTYKRNHKNEIQNINQYRICYLDDNNIYKQKIIQKNIKNEIINETEELEIIFNGDYLDFMPFEIIGVKNRDFSVDIPALIDVVNINISHYKNSADYEQGLYKTSAPFLSITKLDKESQKNIQELMTGSSQALTLTGDAEVNYVEFQGSGLNSIREAMLDKKHNIEALGSRILGENQRNNETAEAAAIHQGAESAILQSISRNISLGLKDIFNLLLEYSNHDERIIDFNLNTDFTPDRSGDDQ